MLIGTPALLRALPPAVRGLPSGFVALDGAAARAAISAAGERDLAAPVGGGGGGDAAAAALIVQTQHPEHYAIRAVQAQDRASFYEAGAQVPGRAGLPALPPALRWSRRAAGRTARRAALAEECAAALRGIAGLTVYPPALGDARRAARNAGGAS